MEFAVSILHVSLFPILSAKSFVFYICVTKSAHIANFSLTVTRLRKNSLLMLRVKAFPHPENWSDSGMKGEETVK